MPRWLSRRLHRRERGAVAVETALVSMVLVMILGGIIDASMMLRDRPVGLLGRPSRRPDRARRSPWRPPSPPTRPSRRSTR